MSVSSLRGLAAGLLCALACACQTAPAPPAFTLRDMTGAYTAFYDRTQTLAPEARIAAFKTEMAGVFPGFYSVERVGEIGITPERYDGMIRRSFERFPGIRERYQRTATQFTAMLEPSRASFERAFPDVGQIGEIYLVHSLGEMDGGTRTIDGKVHLIFGADGIVADNFANAQPFFHHELFHIYHKRYVEECEEVWCGLWGEGLAVYVAHALNPDAPDSELLLTYPVPLRAFVEEHRTQVICDIKTRLHSTTDTRLLFMGGRQIEGMPSRVGYYVGFLIAQEAARTRSLRQLAQLNNAEALAAVQTALAALATCPATAN